MWNSSQRIIWWSECVSDMRLRLPSTSAAMIHSNSLHKQVRPLFFFFFGFCSWFQSFSVNSFHFKVDCFKTGTGKWGVHAKGTQQQKMDIAKPRSKNSPTNTYTRSYFPVEHPSIFWRCQSREWTKEVLLCGSGWFVAPTC